jgi:3-oxoacyl-[acyl-carrier protein] reductase
MRFLEGKVALVTGASRGIGRACAVSLGAAGATVIVNYLSNENAAAETGRAVEAAGGRAVLAGFDVSDASAVDQAVKDCARAQGGIDVLVNNAGVAMNTLTLGAQDADFQRALAVNLGGVFNCTKAALRWLIRSKPGGRVVSITSVVGEAGSAGQGPYAAAKAGIIGLTKTWAREYASRGLLVNAVSPGIVETDMLTDQMSMERRADVLKTIPLGRAGSPEEIASVVAFLCGPGAAYVTGEVIRVNGGLLM